MKLRLILLVLFQTTLFLNVSTGCSQNQNVAVIDTLEVKSTMLKIANKILESTNYNFIDQNNGVVYSKLGDIPQNVSVKLASDYNEWEYQNSLICFGMERMNTGIISNDVKIYNAKKIEFLIDNYPFFKNQRDKGIKTPYSIFFDMKELWYCGLAANVVDSYSQTNDDRLKVFIAKFENHIFKVQARLPDSTLIRIDNGRRVIQSDDAYMAIAFLGKMWKLTGNKRYLNEAITQISSYHNYLFDSKDKLYHHVWYCDENRSGGAYWGRGNGWMLLALVELLDVMPTDHPKRNEILTFYTEQVKSLILLQQPNGLWCQVLNMKTSYNETSCSAMFTYSIARGVNKGWLDSKYKTFALKGWNGLLQKVTPNNEIEGVCVATHFSDDINFYLSRPTVQNDRHVMGSFLLAGQEMIDLSKMK